jgi:hypothetical protein
LLLGEGTLGSIDTWAVNVVPGGADLDVAFRLTRLISPPGDDSQSPIRRMVQATLDG